MTVIDDLKLLASLLPPSLSARYNWDLTWVDQNCDFSHQVSSPTVVGC